MNRTLGSDRCGSEASGRSLSVGLLAVLTAFTVLAVSVSVPTVVGAKAIRFDSVSLEEGLSQNTVACALQDSYGFMWLGTQDGLNRYDGNGFRVYRHEVEDPNSLPANSVLDLVEDPSGDLWVATDGGGLARWHRTSDTFTVYRHDAGNPKSPSSDRVWSLQLTEDGGSLFLGTYDSGLDRLNTRTGVFHHFEVDPEDPRALRNGEIRALEIDGDGNLWVGTSDGLHRIDRTTGSSTRFEADASAPGGLVDSRIRALLEDASGALWVGTYGGGLQRLDGDRFVRYSHDPDEPSSLNGDRVRAIYEDRDDRLWVGTDAGLNLFEPETETFRRYEHDVADPHSLASNRVMAITQDRGGVLWVGTQGGGVSRWNPLAWSFSHYKSGPSGTSELSSNAVMAISEDASGDLWVGTLGGGLNRLDRASGEVETLRHDPDGPSSIGDDRVMALARDRDGTLWIGTLAGGLSALDPATGAVRTWRHDPKDRSSLGADGVMSLMIDRGGRLWVGTFGGGLNLFDRDSETFTRFDHDPRDRATLGGDRAGAIAEDLDGGIWVGTHGGGLSRLDRSSGHFRTFRHDPGHAGSLGNDMVYALHVDADGVLWAATGGGGISRLEQTADSWEKPEFRTFTTRDGLPSNTVTGLLPGEDGWIWASTNHGLVRFDREMSTVEVFTPSHGLQSREFNVGAHYRSERGELFFGGFNGFNAFFPGKTQRNHHRPPVLFTSFSILNEEVELERPIYQTESIQLDHRDHVFALEFAALDYTDPNRNRFAYRIEGLQDEWVDLGGAHRVDLVRPAPGRYRFQVKAANNDGFWTEEPAEIEIVVSPPPWRSWWALSIYLALPFGLVADFTRRQSRRLRDETDFNQRLRAQVEARTGTLAQRNEYLEMLAHRELTKDRRLEAERLRASKLESLGLLAGGIAHDFNNILTAVLGNLSLGQLAAPEDDRLKQFLSRAEASARRASGLTRQLLTFSKGGAPRKEIARVADVVEESAELAVLGSHCRVSFQADPDTSLAEIDMGQIGQVINNLMINAIQAMPEGGEIRVRTGNVGLGRDNRHGLPVGPYVRIICRDEGCGITPENLEQIFDPYFTTKDTGSGLGLATSFSILQKHGGTITVDSEVGVGTCFSLLLPASLGRAKTAEAPGPDWELVNGRGSILLMDDEPTIVEVAQTMLELLGYEVTCTKNGSDAVEAYQEAMTLGRPYEVVILDLTVPGAMGGKEAISRLKTIDPKVTAIVSSGYSDDPVLADHESYGFAASLGKPYELQQVSAVLRRVLGIETSVTGAEADWNASLGELTDGSAGGFPEAGK